MDLILGQYELNIEFSGEGYLIADIRHWHNEEMTPVGDLYVSQEPGGDESPPYSSIRLYLRTDFRYDSKTGETKIVFPLGQSGSGMYKNMIFRVLDKKDTELPYYHLALPEEIINYLVKNEYCAEPYRMKIFHKANSGVLKQVKVIEKL